MKFIRIFAWAMILLLLVFTGCSSKKTTVTTEPLPSAAVREPATADKDALSKEAPPAAIKQEKAETELAKLPEIKKEELAVSPPVGLPDVTKLGCVLPLSGRYADYGSKVLDAILLAADIFNAKKKSNWKIVALDSRETPEDTIRAIAHLADAENVVAIIAVAGSAEAPAAATEAEARKVPLLLITSKEGITAGNKYVFQHFLTSSQQARALAKYALDDLNCAIFTVLYPKDDYGTEMAKYFSAAVEKIGGKVERTVSYEKNRTDFTEEINKISGYGITSTKRSTAGKTETKDKFKVDFEAIFIPDSSARVRMIAAQLAFYDIKGISILGTSMWNSPDLLKKNVDFLEGAIIVDSFFAGGFYPETNDFVDIYYSAYRREPENIEAIAYDSAGMVFNVLENHFISTRNQFAAGLKELANYRGATGYVTFTEDRVAEKTAFILKVINGKLHQVK